MKDQIGWNGRPFDALVRREIIRELIGLMVSDVVKTTADNLEQQKINSAEELQLLPENVASYSSMVSQQLRALKDFLYERMYRHYRLMRMQTKAERYILEIFEAYVKEPLMLPSKTQINLEQLPIEQVVTDYVAGMTDRYALEEWEKLFAPFRRS
jgi:dGTPase